MSVVADIREGRLTPAAHWAIWLFGVWCGFGLGALVVLLAAGLGG